MNMAVVAVLGAAVQLLRPGLLVAARVRVDELKCCQALPDWETAVSLHCACTAPVEVRCP